jgi:hypothetical protein
MRADDAVMRMEHKWATRADEGRKHSWSVYINQLYAVAAHYTAHSLHHSRRVKAEPKQIERGLSAIGILPERQYIRWNFSLPAPVQKCAVSRRHNVRAPASALNFRHKVHQTPLGPACVAELIDEENLHPADSRAAVANTQKYRGSTRQ